MFRRTTHHYDRICWYCNESRDTRAVDLQRRALRRAVILDKVLEPVRAFNADEAQRTCQACGAVHPLAYGFEAADDTTEERAARAGW